MTEIIAVRFRPGGKQYYFDPKGCAVAENQGVIVETGRGLEYGVCVRGNVQVEDSAVVQPLRPLVRVATAADRERALENRGKERDALRVCRKMVERHGLEMDLVRAEYNFDGSKISFFFTSDGRVDFRALVRDLAAHFQTRIELRQIGVRDEARMLGGLGICGQPFCCHRYLQEFQPVSIKMAKTQSLSLNPVKISGACGRLMCCLKHEQAAYEDASKRCPKAESFVECPDGVGTVAAVDLLKEQVKVRLEDVSENPVRTYRVSEIRVVRSGKGRRPEDYAAPPKEELEKLRYVPTEEELQAMRAKNPGLSTSLEQYLGSEGQRPSGRDREGRTAQERAKNQDRPRQEGKSGDRRRRRPYHRGGGKRPQGGQS